MSDQKVTLDGVGVNTGIAQQTDPTHKAARVSLRPNEAGWLGSYRKTLKSGIIAAGLAGPLPVWQMRWGSSDKILIPRKLRAEIRVGTTGFGASAVDSALQLFKTRGHSALDGTSGTYGLYTATKTGAQTSRGAASQFELDTTALRPAQGGIVILNTAAAGLTGGTKTNDTDPIGQATVAAIASAAAETALLAPYTFIDPAESFLNPMELDANEGLNLQISAIGATGTWTLVVEFMWDEYLKTAYYA